MATPDKVLITNVAALRAKHGSDGVDRIKRAIYTLIAADAERGLRTRLVAIDDGRTARSLGISAVTDPSDAECAKRAVDAVDALWDPAYYVLLGSDDVIPMQPLKNPLFSAAANAPDSDLTVPSDLPYASDYGFSTQIAHYRGANRVVGRIPDGHNGKSTAQLRRGLLTAANYQSRPRANYEKPWVLSAAEWRKSTTATLMKIFGTADALLDVPPAEKPWPVSHTRRLMHFFNCHGTDVRAQMQGQRGWYYPVAMNPKDLAHPRRLEPGTVAISEGCYHGKMLQPDWRSGTTFLDTYLLAGAYAFLGSSTEVWGGVDTNEDADYLTRYFTQHVLEGNSTGRALLQARQDYVLRKTVLSPTDLKTLGQFTLYGDPSIHPVLPRRQLIKPDIGPTRGLNSRRRRLRANGTALHASTEHATDTPIHLTAADHDVLAEALQGETRHAFGRGAVSLRYGIVAPGGVEQPPQRHFAALHDTTKRGTHLALAHLEDGVIEELRLLQRR
jgi:hypothetical protein